jgi:hypothetical protein
MTSFSPEEVTKAILDAQNREYLKDHLRYRELYPDREWAQRPYEEITTPDWDEVGTLETSLGTVEEVEQVGGGEGDGEHTHVVLKTVATGQLFRINGHYYSYDGTNWDYAKLYEVRAVTKTVVVYE